MRLEKKYFLQIYFLIFCVTLGFSQELSSDELFLQARNAAFEESDYPKAIELSKKALEKSPDYNDIRIFLGRIYTWSDAKEKARKEFKRVLEKSPDSEEASIAYANLEYWNDNSSGALQIVNDALVYHASSTDLLLYKAKVLNDLKLWTEAEVVVEDIFKIDPKNTKARAMSVKIRDKSAKNSLGISYEYVYFDERFDEAWHLSTLDYGRQTPIGSVITKINYANRFLTEGYQLEIDAYPNISERFSAYASIGFSKSGIFPDFRAGFSLYANLPKSFEVDAGFRYLDFGSATWIYTGAVGKYYGNYWFNLRTYLTPSNDDLSRSLSFTTRYYYGGAADYFGIRIGTGLSPDDPQSGILIGETTEKLISHNLNLIYQKSFKTFNVISITFGVEQQEYKVDTIGNQLDLGIAYTRRF